MAVTQKDFEAEAADIANHLSEHVPAVVLAPFIAARCKTLHDSNNLFKAALFTKACATPTKEAPNGDHN